MRNACALPVFSFMRIRLLANENRAVAMKLIYYTVLMVASPIVVFFGLRDFLLVGELWL